MKTQRSKGQIRIETLLLPWAGEVTLVRNACWFTRGPRFGSQHLNSSYQMLLTAVVQDLMWPRRTHRAQPYTQASSHTRKTRGNKSLKKNRSSARSPLFLTGYDLGCSILGHHPNIGAETTTSTRGNTPRCRSPVTHIVLFSRLSSKA